MTDKPQLDHDNDGKAGGSLPKVKRRPPPAAQVDVVKVRVTKFGADRISTGVHVSGEGDEHHPSGAIIEMTRAAAESLEARHFVEIQ